MAKSERGVVHPFRYRGWFSGYGLGQLQRRRDGKPVSYVVDLIELSALIKST